MISHKFEYHAPASIDEAVSLLEVASGEVAVMAGGTWLVPNMTNAVQQPAIVLDAKRLALNEICEVENEVFVGALATYQQLLSSKIIRAQVPLLLYMAGQITGGPQIVGQGTAGGSACYANPSSDVPACLVALNARLYLKSSRGSREVDAARFYRGAFQTVRSPDEILIGIRIPKMPPGLSFGYHKLKFSAGSWPIVTAACVSRQESSDVHNHRIAVGGANTTPLLFEGKSASNASRGELAKLAQHVSDLIVDEWSDELAGAGYRRRVAPAIVLRALLKSVGAR